MYKLDRTIRPIIPIYDPIKLEWMEDLLYELEVQGEMTRSDAQGFQDCRNDATDYCYEEGMTPEQAAKYLLTEEDGI